jgi:hypothetical protein
VEVEMTVGMIENWARILGHVLDVADAEDLDDFDNVEVFVEQVEAVEGYPNLIDIYLEEAEEPHICVLVPKELVVEYRIEAGVVLECRVRRAGVERIFAHREDIIVHRPE